MKLSIPTTFLATLLAATTSAWELTVYKNDGGHVTTHGRLNSGCVTYDFDMRSAVNRAVFSGSTFADTFELYREANCAGKVAYREGQGEHKVTPARVIRSYKVY